VTLHLHAHSSLLSINIKSITLLYSNHFPRSSLHHSNHSVATMAATDSIPIIKVLFTLHPGMDALDFVGPLEVLSHAKHNINDDCKSMAEISIDPDPSIPICCQAAFPPSFCKIYLPPVTAGKADPIFH